MDEIEDLFAALLGACLAAGTAAIVGVRGDAVAGIALDGAALGIRIVSRARPR